MFIVFEGIDGSGKTTLSNLVATRLRESGLSVKHLRADGKFASSITEAMRELGRDARNLQLTREAEFFLYVARDVQLIAEVLRPALAETDVVIADRFLYTAEVLGRSGRRLPDSLTRPVLEAAALGVTPDFVVLVDVDPTLARARRKSAKLTTNDKRAPSRKGLAGVGLQHRLRRGYLELAEREPDRWVVVDNEGVLEETLARVTALALDARQGDVPGALARFRSASPARPSGGVALDTPEQALEGLLRWVDRRAEREPRTAAYLLAGLAGPGVDERRLALSVDAPEVVLAGLAGLADEASFSLRNSLKGKYPQAVARSLAGLGAHPQAVALRTELEGVAMAEVVSTLGKLESEEAWAIRERAFERVPDATIAALGGLAGERAWKLRRTWRSTAPDLGTSYEASRTAAKSVTGLRGDEAWAWREQARVAAPVAALAAVSGLDDDKSWRWRKKALHQAPKVVMETLPRVTDPRAWALRGEVLRDCKEVVDSINSLDGEEAWALRDACRDVWPSTVVKSLGPQADSPRGRALLVRQLATYPRNVSLLKHAAAIALGLHRPTLTDLSSSK